MANMVKQANLEIEKSKAIADQRLEGYRLLRQNVALATTRLENFERELGIVTRNFESNPSVTTELRRIFSGIEELKGALTIDVRNLKVEEPIAILGDIHGTGQEFIRLQSAFRALEKENSLLRDRYVKWQK